MKTKFDELFEEACVKINETHALVAGIDPKTQEMYWAAFEKFKNDEITAQQWYDICTKLLGDLMEKNRDVFVRLKHR